MRLIVKQNFRRRVSKIDSEKGKEESRCPLTKERLSVVLVFAGRRNTE